MDISKSYDSMINDLVWDKNIKSFWDCMNELQFAKKQRIVMDVRKSNVLSLFPNQRSARHVSYHKQHKDFITEKVTWRIVCYDEIVFLNTE